MSRELSQAELRMLAEVVTHQDATVTVDLWGEGKDRNLSFYAEGTRLEARISLPEEETQ